MVGRLTADLKARGIERATVGRPSEMQGGKKVNTYLYAESVAIAAKLGNANRQPGD